MTNDELRAKAEAALSLDVPDLDECAAGENCLTYCYAKAATPERVIALLDKIRALVSHGEMYEREEERWEAERERMRWVMRSTLGLLNEMHSPTQGCKEGVCAMRTDFCTTRKALDDALASVKEGDA